MRQKFAKLAKSTVKGMTSWLMWGSLSNASSKVSEIGTSLVTKRSSKSTKVTRKMTPMRAKKNVKNQMKNWRAM